MKDKIMGNLAVLAYFSLVMLAIYGWIMNVWTLVLEFVHNAPFTTLLIGRIIGCFVFPLGAVLGFY